ncbi:PKD domain-containing protein [Porifericola rhodea]|uniref:PKD domain-containing protein n=1 Tax=Porifericola rhodea TaxID=930972 RepID=UPI002664F8C9|nr:PKD domain-containing protein [Porifericola rhodea]WKN31260.1 PKD domain-containing protein [Porifericola rhodea]
MKYIFTINSEANQCRFIYKPYTYIFVLFFLVFNIQQLYSQCSTYSNPGNNVESVPQLCAPHDFEWRVWYTVLGSPSTVEFEFVWGDEAVAGTKETIPAVHVGGNVYEATATHKYQRDGNDCNYSPIVTLKIDGVSCPSSPQTQNVTVWDVDERNGGSLDINPTVYRICAGNDATLNFTDNSVWNCVPASGENDRINNPVRWIQWVYGTGGSNLANVQVDGAVRPNNFNGPVEVLPGPVIASGEQSYQIYVPPTTVADVGKEFEITLRNWNICNPYDADTTDGNYLNPLAPGGDSTYISQTARIIVVEKSAPDYRTRLNNSSGPEQDKFCINDIIYFENLTAGIDDDGDGTDDSSFEWEWQFYDDDTESTLLQTKTGKNPNFSYTTSGRKAIKLIARDRNSVGNCGGEIVKYIEIQATPNAAIDVTDTNDQPLSPLCFDTNNPQTIDLRFHDVSSNYVNGTSTWEWNFYRPDGSLISNITGAGAQSSQDLSFNAPGTYQAELISSATGINCETRATSDIHIYAVPEVDYSFDEVCLQDGTTFQSLASLSVSVNGDIIDTYEWDFDYDGVTFDVDASTDANAFTHTFLNSGTYQVAHRVSTQKGSCSAIIVKDVRVRPIPDVGFATDQTVGCSPLEVAFTPNTLIADQPTNVASYVWYTRNLKTNNVSSTIISPAQDSFSATFDNTQSSFVDHEYEVWLEVKAVNGCSVSSAPVKITVQPGPPSNFSITNLSGLDSNCAPRLYKFKVDASTRTLNPDTYHWEVLDLSDSSIVDQQSISSSLSDYSITLLNDSRIRKKYSVKLLAEKSGLCFSSTEKIVDVNPIPSAEFVYEIIEADCEFVRYQLTAEEEGAFYEWTITPTPLSTPDLTERSIEVFFQKNLSNAYNFQASLKTENIIGCTSDVNSKTIEVVPQENIGASFVVSPTIMEIPENTVSITNYTKDGDWTYFWDFGDGNTSTERHPGTHAYAAPGEYTILLKAEGDYCFEEDSAKVIIKQTLPQVDFSFSSIEGCLPLEVSFTNKTLYADSTTFWWDLGDGTLTNEIHPVHTYTETGIYTITLQASNELGIVVKKEVDLVVDLDKGPKADFRVRLAKSYLPGQEISLVNQSQRAVSFFWELGDGTSSTEASPTHVYDSVGYYTIKLTATNAMGCTDTLTQEIFIEPYHPEVDFTYEPPTGCRPLTVQFRNLSRFAEAGTYRWSFGEGEGVSTAENPSYTYYEPGLYTITLEASNSNGVTTEAVKEFSVEVYETPRAAFNLRPSEAFLSEPIYFVNLSIGATEFFWDFGDGYTSTEFEPSHVYEETGIYDVMLIAQSGKGCTDTLKMESAVIVKNGGKVSIPNAFTPNTSGPGGSDANSFGKNDIFLPVFEGVTSFHMMIYNRWGEMLFESFDKNYGWDGYYKGSLCKKDVYVYKLELEFSNGDSNTIVGDLTLVR